MVTSRKINVLPAGKGFLIALFFMFAPAYALSVSIVFFLATLFAGVFCFNLVLGYTATRRLSIELVGVEDLYADSPGSLTIALTNKGPWPLRHLEVSLELDGAATEPILIKYVGKHQTERVTFIPRTRGWLPLSRIHCASSFPFGLISTGLTLQADQKLLVYPRILDQTAEILQAEREDQGSVPRNSGDYQYLGPYSEGDDVRLIHWKKSTLLENPVIKKDLIRGEATEPRLFIPDPCPEFERAVSMLATHILERSYVPWAVQTEQGVRLMETRQAMLAALALIQPVHTASTDHSEQGYRPLRASALTN